MIALLLGVAMSLVVAPAARAVSFEAVDTEDEWRAALTGADTASPNTITITGSFTISGSADPVYAGGSQPLTVRGGGFTIDAGGNSRILDQPGTGGISIEGLTLTHGTTENTVGAVKEDNYGGAIRTFGPVTVTDSSFVENRAKGSPNWNVAGGGAIYTKATVMATRSKFVGNTVVRPARGTATAFAEGGAIEASGAATIIDTEFSRNTASATGERYAFAAGGALVGSRLDIRGSSFVGNSVSVTAPQSTRDSAPKGGAAVGEQVTVRNSTFRGNSATIDMSTAAAPASAFGQGGALWSSNLGDAVVTGTTFVDNSVSATGGAGELKGGGFYAVGGARIENSTFVSNRAEEGGAISAETLDLRNVTLTGNSALRGASLSAPGFARISASLFNAAEGGGQHCKLAFGLSQGYNYADDISCATLTATGDNQAVGNDPLLGPLQDNGGSTETRAPLAGSPLLDTTPTAKCFTATDQRGEARPAPSGGACDTGAVESALPAVIPGVEIGLTPSSQMVKAGESASFTVTVENTGDTELTNIDVTSAGAPDCFRSGLGPLAARSSLDYACTLADLGNDTTVTATVTADSVAGPDTTTATSDPVVVTVREGSMPVDDQHGDARPSSGSGPVTNDSTTNDPATIANAKIATAIAPVTNEPVASKVLGNEVTRPAPTAPTLPTTGVATAALIADALLLIGAGTILTCLARPRVTARAHRVRVL